jgi:hypothetical protein
MENEPLNRTKTFTCSGLNRPRIRDDVTGPTDSRETNPDLRFRAPRLRRHAAAAVKKINADCVLPRGNLQSAFADVLASLLGALRLLFLLRSFGRRFLGLFFRVFGFGHKSFSDKAYLCINRLRTSAKMFSCDRRLHDACLGGLGNLCAANLPLSNYSAHRATHAAREDPPPRTKKARCWRASRLDYDAEARDQ